jgi:molybdate transport system ATP-binding protein
MVVDRPDGFSLDAELEVPEGHTTALVGPNGAGKSTVVAVLAGLLPLQAGRISFGDEVVDDPTEGIFRPAAERGVGVVFQDGLLFPHLSVLGNVAFGLQSVGMAGVEARRRARGWLERLGVGDLANRRPAELSGGQRQRIALARALASGPRVLLLDEPMSALDVQARTSMRRTLADHLSERPEPRLLVTHDPVEAFLLADRIAIIEDGRITQSGTPEQVRLHPRTAYAADLVGINLLTGTLRDDVVTVGGAELRVAARDVAGAVLVSVHPRAISLARERPVGSQRNVWATTVEVIEDLGDRVRVLTGDPLPLTAEVTRAAVSDLALTPGGPVWVAIKATEIGVTAADSGTTPGP